MTTTTLRPDGNPGAGLQINIGLTGAASVEAALSDNSDASYVSTDPTLSSTCVVTLGTVALPAGAVTKTATLRVRASQAVNTGADVRLTIGGGFPIIVDGIALVAAISTVSGTPTAVTLTQTDIDALQVTLANLAYSPRVINFYEAYLDLTYALQPTAAVSAPTGTVTLTSQPSIVFSHTAGSDGGAQAAFQARVFSAAEYGVAGFNPTTSPGTSDSGIVLGSATTINSGTLANSTTYRAYVRTAQSINGVLQWSDWAFSSFTTSFTLPTIASIVVTPDSTLARQRLTVTRTVMTPTWIGVEVQRSTDGGTTWAAVRGATNVAPPGDVWIGYDYESPNGVAAIYRARAIATSFTGPWLTSSSSSWSSTSTWLKDLRSTSLNRTVRAQLLPSPVRGREQGVHVILGRADPIVISDVRKTIAGTISFATATETAANDLIALFSAQVLLLQTPTSHRFGSRYIAAIGDLTEARVTRMAQEQWRYWQADFVEVVAPVDTGLVVAGLTWQDIVSTYALWSDLIAAKATWGDLI